MFGTLYIFTLFSLVLQVDRRPALHRGRPAHRLRDARCDRPLHAPAPSRLLPRAHRRGYWSLVIFSVAVPALPLRRVHRQRPAAAGPLRRAISTVPVLRDYSEDDVRPGPAAHRGRLHRPDAAAAHRARMAGCSGRRSRSATTPSSRTCRSRRPRRPPAEPARHRRPGARRAGPGDLRLPHLGAVRLHADPGLLAWSASPPARCRASMAGSPTCCSSASSRSGRACRSSTC